MTSFLPPLTLHTPPSAEEEPVETSLDLAKVPESERYPTILTRLDSGGSDYVAGPDSAQEKKSPACSSEAQHRKTRSNTFGISAGSDREEHPETSHQADMDFESRPGRQSRSPPTQQEPEEDDVTDTGEEGQSDSEESPQRSGKQHQGTRKRSKSPAYVAPIPKIGGIPQVSPGISISAPDRPDIPPFVGSMLVGKLIDEDGDIVDEKTGQVLAHAAGDLPSMVGRRVSNAQGDILGDNEELLGYVADIEWPRDRPPPTGPPRSLFDLMKRANSSLMVDHKGNILDASGKVVGKFHDNNNPLHRKEKEEREARDRTEPPPPPKERSDKPGENQQPRSPPPLTSAPPQQQHEEREEEREQEQEEEQSQSQSDTGEGQPRQPRRTEEERRQNAESWRKENPNESPSDIFLDVKSTREGIQLTIRIPTVFNGQQTTPHISFS